MIIDVVIISSARIYYSGGSDGIVSCCCIIGVVEIGNCKIDIAVKYPGR